MRALVGAVALALSLVVTESARPAAPPARLYCARGPLSIETEWAEDSLIVSGTVEEFTEVTGADGFLERTIYQFRVRHVYRGHPASALAVYSDNDSGRFPMQRGVRYLLFLSRWEDGHLHVDNCGNSRPFARAADVVRRLRALAGRARAT